LYDVPQNKNDRRQCPEDLRGGNIEITGIYSGVRGEREVEATSRMMKCNRGTRRWWRGRREETLNGLARGGYLLQKR
jgi:hypothetical protein